MEKVEVYDEGFERGYRVASWVDLPEAGAEIPKHLDWIGLDRVESVSDAEEYFLSLCSESESNDRQYSPFEFTAKDLNDLEETASFEVWEAYDEGIHEGFKKSWEERSKDYYDEEDFEED